MTGSRQPTSVPTIVFLLDVDNTLLDNDSLKEEIARRAESLVGAERAATFWRLYEEVRNEEGYVDFPTTVQRWVESSGDPNLGAQLITMLGDLPFRDFVFPGVFRALDYLWTLGAVAILSDGDRVFQPLKIRESGLQRAVHDNVLIYVHKEEHLAEVFRLLPADHYVIIDDKPRILAAVERECPTTFTTVFVLQGKYAVQDEFQPEPDFTIREISDVRHMSAEQFRADSRSHPFATPPPS
ncbi:MAG: hypothetical protein PVSMB7_28500 [Chloroflexota bacterium]